MLISLDVLPGFEKLSHIGSGLSVGSNLCVDMRFDPWQKAHVIFRI